MGHSVINCPCGSLVMEGRNDWKCDCGKVLSENTGWKWESTPFKDECGMGFLNPCLTAEDSMIYYSSVRQRWEDTTNPWWFVGMREEEDFDFSFTFNSKDNFYKWLLNDTKYLDGDK